MTNDLEKQFFDTFGIEPKPTCVGCELWINECYYDCGEFYLCKADLDRDTCGYKGTVYPQITDTHYLKLICELSKCKAFFNNFYRLQNVDIEQLKEQVLTDCIFQAIFFKDQVRTLFEEG